MLDPWRDQEADPLAKAIQNREKVVVLARNDTFDATNNFLNGMLTFVYPKLYVLKPSSAETARSTLQDATTSTYQLLEKNLPKASIIQTC